jgi:hypothetical protein
MNSIDEQLRSAARAARETFPPGRDMPPLSLPGMPAGHGSGRRHGLRDAGTGHARQWLAPAAAAAAVAILVSGIVALQQSGREHAGHTGAPQSSQTAIAQQQARKQRQSLDALVVAAFAPATGPQYDQGTRLIWLVHGKELRATASCMAASGYHVSGASQPFNLATYADNTEWPDLPRIARTHEFVAPGGVRVSNEPKVEQRAFNECYQRAGVTYRALLNPGQALESSWWRVVSRIQASARVRAAVPALSACASRYGYPDDPYGNATGPIKSFADFMDWVAGFLDGADSRGASAATMRALERHWTTIFLSCARPIVGVFQRMQLAAQPGFLRQNASQLNQLDQLAWQLLGPQSAHQ